MEKAGTKKLKLRMIVIAAFMLCVCILATGFTYAASEPVATAMVKSRHGAIVRKAYSAKSKKVVKVKKNRKIQLIREVVTSPTKTDSKHRWYYIKVGSKYGYIRANQVKYIKYNKQKRSTTDALNVRYAPTTKAKIKGLLKKGASVDVILPASYKKSNNWYKVRIGLRNYYVCKSYVTGPGNNSGADASPNTVPVVSNSIKAPKPTVQAETGLIDKIEIADGIEVTGLTYPVKIGQSLPCSLKGVIKSDEPITYIKVGIKNSSGKWVITVTDEPNATSYNLASKPDQDIKFGTLSVGKYTYRVEAKIGGKTYTIANYSFNVYRRNCSSVLAREAVRVAWPKGTASSSYTKPKGSATPEYAGDLAYVFGGKAPAGGASCDVFVCTMCRATGYDPDMPAGLGAQWKYLASSPKWTRVGFTYSQSDLQEGDIIIYKKNNGSWHVCMYVKAGGTGCLAEASYTLKRYGFINSSLSKVLKKDKSKIAVYRTTY